LDGELAVPESTEKCSIHYEFTQYSLSSLAFPSLSALSVTLSDASASEGKI
jgi:hypothetical protein